MASLVVYVITQAWLDIAQCMLMWKAGFRRAGSVQGDELSLDFS